VFKGEGEAPRGAPASMVALGAKRAALRATRSPPTLLAAAHACKMDPRVERYSAWLAAAMCRQGRDESHGLAHFHRVRKTSLDLVEQEQQRLSARELLLLQLAALSHDVLDHKYFPASAQGVREKEEMKSAMESTLRELPLTPEEVQDVCLISDNVSLSKELGGRLQETELLRRGLMRLRDFVSDADKLDALGVGGLHRLAQFQASALRKEGKDASVHLTSEMLKQKAEELLVHRVQFLRTQAAQQRGQQLLRETLCTLNSKAALDRIVRRVLVEEMLRAFSAEL